MERIKWLCSKALLHVCAFTWTVLPQQKAYAHTKTYLSFLIEESHFTMQISPPCFLRVFEGEKKQFYLVFFFFPTPLYLLKSHFIKVMDNASNKIATAAIIARQWHHVAGRTKYDSPLNAYDLQNLLQVHTVIKGGGEWISASWCWEALQGVYFTLTVNQCYQPPSDNAFIIKFHICISI